MKLLSFDLQLEKFGVDLNQLKLPETQRIFRAWLEEWETNNLKKQDCVIESRFLEMYKDLVFLDPDLKLTFTVSSQISSTTAKRMEGGISFVNPMMMKEKLRLGTFSWLVRSFARLSNWKELK